MNIEIKYPTERELQNWDFPCLGIRHVDDLIVAFHEYGKGTVMEPGVSMKGKYSYYSSWDMNDFEPAYETTWGESKSYWERNNKPIPAITDDGTLIEIINTPVMDNDVEYKIVRFNKTESPIFGKYFVTKEERDEWLGKLDILPEGVEIKIKI